jgi:hypothetical protein
MGSKHLHALALALLASASVTAWAANDGQSRVNELLSADPDYRETWSSVVKKEERLPDWVINLSGASEQMNAVTEDGDKYLVAFSLDKSHAYAMLVEVPAGLPADKSPTRHADYRFLGKPDEGMQGLLKEQLKKDPNWY